ncbi:MAG TPA: hypothetical protein EYP39_08300 [Ghiorsea sp.]|nr:hypothetical protein [Ghiorsea sp.]
MLIGSLLPLMLMFFGANMITVLLVGLGQAHFIHCYIYQFRAKQVDMDKVVKWVAGLSLAGVGCWWLGDDVMIPAALVFILHQFSDDFYLYRKQVQRLDVVQLVLVLMACLSLAMFELNTMAQTLAAALMVVALLVGFIGKQKVVFWTLTIPFALPLFYVLQNYQARDWLIPLGIIILSHYLRWMMYVYQTRAQEQKWGFVTEALILNAIFLLYALATMFGGHSEWLNVLLQGLFSIQAFVVWTMAHIFSTIRPRLFTKKARKSPAF